MVIPNWTVLASLAAASFASEPGSRYVFSLLDSAYRIQSEREIVLPASAAPDTLAVRAKAQSLATWPSGIRLDSAAVDGVWMAYEPPADPGDVVFVSATDPVQPLLVLRIDAMCGGCIHGYDAYGDTAIPRATVLPVSDPIVSDLEDRFGYGVQTTAAEKDSIAHALARSGFPSAPAPIRIHVLKPHTLFPSTEGIAYIAYYVVRAPVSALRPVRAETKAVYAPSGRKVDALGRSMVRDRAPAEALPRALWAVPQGN